MYRGPVLRRCPRRAAVPERPDSTCCTPVPGGNGGPSTTAAKHGHLRCLRRAIVATSYISQHTVAGAAAAGSVACLQLLWQHRPEAFTRDAILAAAQYGQIDALKYVCEQLDYKGRSNIHPCYLAAESGSVECLEYLVTHGYRLCSRTIANAAAVGNLECLRYLREAGCEHDHETSSSAARGSHFECLRYSIECGMSWWPGAFHVKDPACLLYIERNGPFQVKDMVLPHCHPVYDALVNARVVVLYVLARAKLPVPLMETVLTQAGLRCGDITDNDKVSEASDSSLELL